MKSDRIMLKESWGRTKVYDETNIQYPVSSKNSTLFQLLFLIGDERVEVVETQEIDAEQLIKRLKKGQSVFITCKPQKRGRPWYFTRF